jgi:hypothetical protein
MKESNSGDDCGHVISHSQFHREHLTKFVNDEWCKESEKPSRRLHSTEGSDSERNQ